MKINSEIIKNLRNAKGWTQQHLAEVTGVSLRTIQRIEKTGQTSQETISAFCSVFDIERRDISIIPKIDESNQEYMRAIPNSIVLGIVFLLGAALGVFIAIYLI